MGFVAALQLYMSTENLFCLFMCRYVFCLFTWKAAAVIGGVSLLHTGASIVARRGAAWHVGRLTVLAGVLMRTATVE